MAAKIDLVGFKQLLMPGGLAELGPGPRAGVLSEAELSNNLKELFAANEIPANSRDLITALLLLWHDHMDASHEISQSIENPDGNFLHGIVHRREPDYGNAAYWFGRVGLHEAFPTISNRVGQAFASKNEIDFLLEGRWDAFALIDACQKVSHKPADDPRVRTLRQVQAIESEVLLERFVCGI